MSSRYMPFRLDPTRSTVATGNKIKKFLGFEDEEQVQEAPNLNLRGPAFTQEQLIPDIPDLKIPEPPSVRRQKTVLSVKEAPAIAANAARIPTANSAPRDVNELYKNIEKEYGYTPEDTKAFTTEYGIDPFRPQSLETPGAALGQDEFVKLSEKAKAQGGNLKITPQAETLKKIEEFKKKREDMKNAPSTWLEEAQGAYAGLQNSLGRFTNSMPLAALQSVIDANVTPEDKEAVFGNPERIKNTTGFTLANVAGNILKTVPATLAVGPVAANALVMGEQGLSDSIARQQAAGKGIDLGRAAIDTASEATQGALFGRLAKAGLDNKAAQAIYNRLGSPLATAATGPVVNAIENVGTSAPISLGVDYAADNLFGTNRLETNPYITNTKQALLNDIAFGAALPIAMNTPRGIEAYKAGASVPEALANMATGESLDIVGQRQAIDADIKRNTIALKESTTPNEKRIIAGKIAELKEARKQIGKLQDNKIEKQINTNKLPLEAEPTVGAIEPEVDPTQVLPLRTEVDQSIPPEPEIKSSDTIKPENITPENLLGSQENVEPIPWQQSYKQLIDLTKTPEVAKEIEELGYSPTFDELTPAKVSQMLNIPEAQAIRFLDDLATPIIPFKEKKAKALYTKTGDGRYILNESLDSEFIQRRLQAKRPINKIVDDTLKKVQENPEFIDDSPFNFTEKELSKQYRRYQAKENLLTKEIKRLMAEPDIDTNPTKQALLKKTRDKFKYLEMKDGSMALAYKLFADDKVKKLEELFKQQEAAKLAPIPPGQNKYKRGLAQSAINKPISQDGTLDEPVVIKKNNEELSNGEKNETVKLEEPIIRSKDGTGTETDPSIIRVDASSQNGTSEPDATEISRDVSRPEPEPEIRPDTELETSKTEIEDISNKTEVSPTEVPPEVIPPAPKKKKTRLKNVSTSEERLSNIAKRFPELLDGKDPIGDLVDILTDEGVLLSKDDPNYNDLVIRDESKVKKNERLPDGSIPRDVYDQLPALKTYLDDPLKQTSKYAPLISKLTQSEYISAVEAARELNGLPKLTPNEKKVEYNFYKNLQDTMKAIENYDLKQEELSKAITEKGAEDIQTKIDEADEDMNDKDLQEYELKDSFEDFSSDKKTKYAKLSVEYMGRLPKEILLAGDDPYAAYRASSKYTKTVKANEKVLTETKQKFLENTELRKTYTEAQLKELTTRIDKSENKKAAYFGELYNTFLLRPDVIKKVSTEQLRKTYKQTLLEENIGLPNKRLEATVLKKVLEEELQLRSSTVEKKSVEQVLPKQKSEEPPKVSSVKPSTNRSPLLDNPKVKLVPVKYGTIDAYKVIEEGKPTSGGTNITYRQANGEWRESFVKPALIKPDSTRETLQGGTKSTILGGSVFGFTPQMIDGLVTELATATKDGISLVKQARQLLQDEFAAPSKTRESRLAANLLREASASYHIESTRLEQMMEPIIKYVDTLNEGEINAFVDNIEAGKPQANATLDEVASLVRESLDSRRSRLQSESPGAIKNFIENYFPHIWTKESQEGVSSLTRQLESSLEGPKNFLRKRKILTVAEGRRNGLVPLDPNPIRQTLLKIREVDRFLEGEKAWKEGLKYGIIKGFSPTETPPPNWVRLRDKKGTDSYYQYKKKKKKTVKVEEGYYYAPPEVARIFNNYISKGIGDVEIHEAWRYVGRLTNMVKVSFSAFHAYNIVYDSFITKLQAGTDQLGRGISSIYKGKGAEGVKEFKEGLKSIATGLAAPITYGYKGTQLRRYVKYSDTKRPNPTVPTLGEKANTIAESVAPDYLSRIADNPIAKMQYTANQLLKKSADLIFGDPAKMPDTMKKTFDQQIEALRISGGRIEPDAMYISDDFTNKFFNALKEGKPLRTAVYLPAAVAELVSRPIMHHYIPSVKLMAFTDLYQRKVDSMDPTSMSKADHAEIGRQVWDQVEDRMGEVTYENYFFNKITKQALYAAVAFPGWNIGSSRSIFGAALDTARVPFKVLDRISRKELGGINPGKQVGPRMNNQDPFQSVIPEATDPITTQRGKNKTIDKSLRYVNNEILPLNLDDPIVTNRMKYMLNLAYGIAAFNALYLLAQGNPAEEWKDYFYPPTGNINPDGSKERTAPPTIAKDVYGFTTQPVESISGKMRQEFNTILNTINNKDYQGFQIANENDPVSQQLYDKAMYVLGQTFTPYSLANEQKRQRAKAYNAEEESLASRIGHTLFTEPLAPYYITRSPAQQMLGEYSRSNMPVAGIPRDVKDKLESRQDIKEALELGDIKPLQEAINSNYLSPTQAKSLIDTYPIVPDELKMRRLNIDQALNVYEIASPTERKKFAGAIIDKMTALDQKTPEERRRILDKMDKLGIAANLNDNLYEHHYTVDKEKINAISRVESRSEFRQLSPESQKIIKDRINSAFSNFRISNEKNLPNEVIPQVLQAKKRAFNETFGNPEFTDKIIEALLKAGPYLEEGEKAKAEVVGDKDEVSFDYEETGNYEDYED